MIEEPIILNTEAEHAATIHLTIPGQDMPTYMDPAIKEIMHVLADQGITPSGPMFSYHHRMPSATFDFEIGFPVATPVKPTGRVQASQLPAAKVARTIYQGPYEGLADAWGAFGAWVKKSGMPAEDRFFESYLGDPSKMQPSEYRTQLNRILVG